MNEFNKNELKFQLLVILKQSIGQILMVLIFSINLGVTNVLMIYQLKDRNYTIIPSAFLILLAMLITTNTCLTTVYKKTVCYFISIGYTRKKYYFGIMVFNIILSIISTAVTFLSYVMSVGKYENDIRIPYMGFNFKGLNLYSYFGILIISFIMLTLIFAIANFISIISFSSTLFTIIVNAVLLTSLLCIYIKKHYIWKIINLVFDANKSFSLIMIFYTIISIMLYVLAKKVFMRIDIE
jgi:hypothetical protein